jgi:hypothetical protein
MRTFPLILAILFGLLATTIPSHAAPLEAGAAAVDISPRKLPRSRTAVSFRPSPTELMIRFSPAPSS